MLLKSTVADPEIMTPATPTSSTRPEALTANVSSARLLTTPMRALRSTTPTALGFSASESAARRSGPLPRKISALLAPRTFSPLISVRLTSPSITMKSPICSEMSEPKKANTSALVGKLMAMDWSANSSSSSTIAPVLLNRTPRSPLKVPPPSRPLATVPLMKPAIPVAVMTIAPTPSVIPAVPFSMAALAMAMRVTVSVPPLPSSRSDWSKVKSARNVGDVVPTAKVAMVSIAVSWK